jgi:DNA-binding MarR family transcriptional regulator
MSGSNQRLPAWRSAVPLRSVGLIILALASMAAHGTPRKRPKYRTGRDGLVRWSDTHAAAWIGLLETHKQLVRELEAELEAEHGLSLSGFELMSRLARADGRMLRLTALAEAAGLSLSRVSRILDMLEKRGLVERRADTDDTRAKNALLTQQGLDLLRAAQKTHFAGVERLFFDRLREQDVETLARVFAPFRR